MPESPLSPRSERETGKETGAATERHVATAYPGTPRWVKVSAIVALVLILLVVAVLLVTTALGLHTPGGPGGHGR